MSDGQTKIKDGETLQDNDDYSFSGNSLLIHDFDEEDEGAYTCTI